MYRSPFTDKARQTLGFKTDGDYAAGYHTGVDWYCEDPTIVAPCDATLLRNEWDNSYGNFIVFRTHDNKVFLFAHLKYKPDIKTGKALREGEKIAVMGSSGNATGPHLHIELEDGKEWTYNKRLLNPDDYIDFSDYGKESEEDFMAKTYKNGSTREYVYQTVEDCKKKENSIGWLDEYETCECVGIYSGCYAVVYNTPATKKIGFVNYSGGVK